MKKIYVSIWILIGSIFLLQAQNSHEAETLINDLLESINTKGISSDFNLKIYDENLVNLQELSGKLVMQADKFHLDTDLLSLWFNGSTQWVYMKEIKEVNISSPTVEELTETNPMMMIKTQKANCRISMSGNKDAKNHSIVFKPKSSNADFTKLIIQIDKASKQLKSVKIEQANAATNEITFRNFQKDATICSKMFNFDQTKYKGVVINDLR